MQKYLNTTYSLVRPACFFRGVRLRVYFKSKQIGWNKPGIFFSSHKKWGAWTHRTTRPQMTRWCEFPFLTRKPQSLNCRSKACIWNLRSSKIIPSLKTRVPCKHDKSHELELQLQTRMNIGSVIALVWQLSPAASISLCDPLSVSS